MATGWVHWGGGSSGIAASQNPHVAFGPVRLDVVGVLAGKFLPTGTIDDAMGHYSKGVI